jgi:rsbT co-antagonist protein RsbR
LIYLICCTFGFGIFGSVAFLLSRHTPTGLVASTMFLYGLTLLVARTQVRRGELTLPVMIMSIGLLVVGIIVMLAMPVLLSSVVLIPMVVVVLALPYIEKRALLAVMAVCLLTNLITVLIDVFVPEVFQPLPPLLGRAFEISSLTSITCMVLFLLWQFSSRLTETMSQMRVANQALQAAQAGLELQVVERTAALKEALAEVEARAAEQERLLAENEQQRHTIRELSVPVLPISNDLLVMPLVGVLDTGRLQQINEQALHALERSGARHLFLDITGVPVIDSEVAEGLVTVVQAARLLGAEVVLVGIRPEVAQAIVGLGINLQTIRTSSDLQGALTMLQAPRLRRIAV